jgi:hypothetical protein
MNRRDTLKKLAAATGALITLPSWADSWTSQDFASFHSSFQGEQQVILSSVVDTIIPQGDGIGALSVGVDKFLEKLIDKCYEPAVGENVKKQLQSLEADAQSSHGKSYPSCDQKQREALLLKYSSSQNKDEKEFFSLIKRETIRGFNTSKEVMTKYLDYKVAPGHYYGCVDVKTS